MLKIKTIPVNMLEVNCYIVSDDSKECIIIDCGALDQNDRDAIQTYIEEEQLHVMCHVCTHMHYDHCFGVRFIQDRYQVAPSFHEEDDAIYKGLGNGIFGPLRKYMSPELLPKPAAYIKDGDTIAFGQHSLQVIHTPGHSPGGICLYCASEGILFSGDTLFQCSVGRSDFAGGNAHLLSDSIHNRLFTLPDNVKVYPGHGMPTEIGYEKQNNPYI